MNTQDEPTIKAHLIHEAKFFVCLMVLFVVFGVLIVVSGSFVITDCGLVKLLEMVSK